MGKFAWKIMAGITAAIATAVANKVIRNAWQRATGDKPPERPENPDLHWGFAIGWAVLSATFMAVFRLVALRRAANYFRNSTGELPKAVR